MQDEKSQLQNKESALRILRACRQLGIEAVVAYSEADRESRAVLVADEAIVGMLWCSAYQIRR